MNVDFNNDYLLQNDETYDIIKEKLKSNTLNGFYVENNDKNCSYKFFENKWRLFAENAKKYFFMIKKSLKKQVSVKKLKDTWISEADRIFNLSTVEALNILETLGEEVELIYFKNSKMNDIVKLFF